MSRCGLCGGTLSEDTLVKHAFYCEDDRKAPSLADTKEVDDIIKEKEENDV